MDIPIMPIIIPENYIIYKHEGRQRAEYLFTNDNNEFVYFNKYQMEFLGINLSQSNQIYYQGRVFNFVKKVVKD
jgi:hypothetical protein